MEIGVPGQKILDLGTGTGVLPRAMYRPTIDFCGIDSSKNQIEIAKTLSEKEGKKIKLYQIDSENIEFGKNTFDAVTSVQSWHYFDSKALLPKIVSVLKPEGKLAIVFMYWLPFEDDLAKASESLILKYNPSWSGSGIKRIDPEPRAFARKSFKSNHLVTYEESIPFTQETWLGRIRASRGIGASLNKKQIERFDEEHEKLIKRLRPKNFTVLHQITIEVYELVLS